jgi:dipeptidyl-peptidase-4
MQRFFLILIALIWTFPTIIAQDNSKVTLDRIYTTNDFRQERLTPVQWMANGDEYVQVERNRYGKQFVIKHNLKTGVQETILTPGLLTPKDASDPLYVEKFSFSKDESKMLLFTNSARVWRANTRGDYWVYDLQKQTLTQLGSQFPESTLMFAKFSDDQSQVAYVQDLNIYVENLDDGNITQLTTNGGGDIINGTFDWAYEEEFSCRDGFRWNPNGTHIAYWNIDASSIGTFYMINNTDDVYSRPIPLRYPKAGDDPSAAKVGIVDVLTQQTHWIDVPGDLVQNYIPGMQWIDENKLLIQQINRHQNHLKIFTYNTKNNVLKLVYEEFEDTWIDIKVPDASSRERKENLVHMVDDGEAFLRLNETDGWRHVYKIGLKNGKKTLLTDGDYDVASLIGTSDGHVYFHASPTNSTQRFLYRVSIDGKGDLERVTPDGMDGLNRYNVAPKGNFALHYHNAVLQPMTVNLISLPEHKPLRSLVTNEGFSSTLQSLDLPEVEFTEVNTPSGQNIDIRIIKPTDFDPDKKYPVLFHVYGEPWSQMATDTFVGMWNIMLAQMGYVIVDLDNRGTPCLKGSEWRKSIYRKVGVLNVLDMSEAAQEVLKIPIWMLNAQPFGAGVAVGALHSI